MDTAVCGGLRRTVVRAAPPNATLINGHMTDLAEVLRIHRAAPPNATLINGHAVTPVSLLHEAMPHRPTRP